MRQERVVRMTLSFCLLCCVIFVSHASARTAYVLYHEPANSFRVAHAVDLNKGDGFSVSAQGTYDDMIDTTGWGILRLESNEAFNDSTQAYAVGFLEGYFTHERIFQMWTNYRRQEWASQNATYSDALGAYMTKQLGWIREQVAANANDAYWAHMGLLVAQFDGLAAGYQAYAPPSNALSALDLYMLTSAGDLETLNDLFDVQPRSKLKADIPQEYLLTDCSGFIKVTTDDVYFGHTTWRYYYAMLRIYKYYTLNFSTGRTTTAFSSSPGFLSSKDDYYITDRGLMVMETTNSIFNTSLYQYITPTSALVWQRAVVANRLASSAAEWASTFALHNSGTYNNQWMVLSARAALPALQKGERLPEGTFWVLEQIPGNTTAADLTDSLASKGFWSSYNIPYFENIFNISGYPDMVEKNGNSFSYTNCSRAFIFERNATQVVGLESMKALMQYNDYEIDPLSLGSASNAVSSRYDLLSSRPAPFGGVDSKVTSASAALGSAGPAPLCSAIISGPTHQQQAPFQWSASPWAGSVSIVGLPDLWDFDWLTTCLFH